MSSAISSASNSARSSPSARPKKFSIRDCCSKVARSNRLQTDSIRRSDSTDTDDSGDIDDSTGSKDEADESESPDSDRECDGRGETDPFAAERSTASEVGRDGGE